MLSSQPRTFSSSVSSAVSRITLQIARPSLQASTTARMSLRTTASSRALERADVDDHVDLARALADRAPRLERLGLRRLRAEREADDAAHLDRCAAQQRRRLPHVLGLTQTEKKPWRRASSHSFWMSAGVASGLRSVWSISGGHAGRAASAAPGAAARAALP